MTKQPTIPIKKFANGDALTYEPCSFGVGTLRVNGERADYRPFLQPKPHPSGLTIAAMLIVGKQQYGITKDDLDAVLAANKHYIPTIFDRMSRLEALEDSARICASSVGAAWNDSIEHARVKGWRPDTAADEAAERQEATDTRAKFEAAKQADPEAWARIEARRADDLRSAMNH